MPTPAGFAVIPIMGAGAGTEVGTSTTEPDELTCRVRVACSVAQLTWRSRQGAARQPDARRSDCASAETDLTFTQYLYSLGNDQTCYLFTGIKNDIDTSDPIYDFGAVATSCSDPNLPSVFRTLAALTRAKLSTVPTTRSNRSTTTAP